MVRSGCEIYLRCLGEEKRVLRIVYVLFGKIIKYNNRITTDCKSLYDLHLSVQNIFQ